MLAKPVSCNGCALRSEGVGFMDPTLSVSGYGVTLIGEALGEQEASIGKPFQGPAGFKLSRLIEWAGLERAKFDIWNVVWCKPPGNLLEGQSYEFAAISHCKRYWEPLINRSRVLVPMGNVALGALTGKKGILNARGYVQPGPLGTHILPTVHPSFIQRGQSKYSAPFIHDLQRAVAIAEKGLPMEVTNYLLDPLAGQAMVWARDVVQSNLRYLAFDIETPYKAEDEGEVADGDDPTYHILRIGFAVEGRRALSVPWSPEYFPVIRLLLGSRFPKVVWNGSFDVPRVKAAGFPVNGTIHDGMVAWHILHSDLPKGLGFVATFTCPDQPRWKHLNSSQPAFYNATDADVELRSMVAIEEELRRVGLWEVYERDVVQLDPILKHMEDKGMPINGEVRLDRAVRLEEKLQSVMARMEDAVPQAARKVEHVYKKAPKETSGLQSRRVIRPVSTCSACGGISPTKPHFRVTKKKPNPCAGAKAVQKEVEVEEWYRLAPFKPSREQLIRYQQVMGRKVPMTTDKKTKKKKPTMDEKAIKGLISLYPSDILYPSILEYRELDKLAGTYIGRPNSNRRDESRPR